MFELCIFICDYTTMLEIDIQSSLCIQHPKGIDSKTLMDIKIHGCSSPIYKIAYYCWPSISARSTSMDSTNCVFHRSLIESVNAEPTDSEGQLYSFEIFKYYI